MHEIHQAAIDGDLEKITALQVSGTDINLEDGNGRTVLHLAIIHNHENLIEPLLGLGAKVQATDNQIRKPIFYAAQAGNASIVNKLIKHKATPEYGIKGTAYWFVIRGATTEIERFKDWGIDINRDPLLEYAREYGQLKTIIALEKLGVKSETRQIDKKELYFTFGGEKLKSLLRYEKGGDPKNTLGLLFYYLSHYLLEKIKENVIDQSSAEKICNRFRKLYDTEKTPEQILEQLQQEGLVDILVGSKEHAVIISFQKNSEQKNKVDLLILDKTALNRFVHIKDAKKQPSIQVITVENNTELLTKILKKLKELANLSYAQLEEFIRNEIPKMTDSKYVVLKEPSKSEAKVPSCFFSNVKLAAEKVMFDELGIKKGLEIYKDFMLYFREKVANDFFSTNTASSFKEITFNEQAEEIIRGILMEKKSKSTPIIGEEEQVSALKSP